MRAPRYPKAVVVLGVVTLLLIGCGDDEVTNPPPEPTGTLAISTASVGSAIDADGYTVRLDGIDAGAVGTNDSVAVGVAVGQYAVELTGLADNCGVIGENPTSATAVEDAATTVQFSVSCPPFYDYIAYQLDQDIYVMESDGSNPFNLTSHLEPTHRHYLDWSPDGTRLVFRRYAVGTGGDYELHVMRVDGSSPVAIARHSVIQNAEWSPDGSRIAFVGGDESSEIWVVNPDGSNPVNLTNSVELEYDLTWAPDASRIAYTRSGVDGVEPFGYWVMDADGTDPTPLEVVNGGMAGISWSPDGTRIAGYAGSNIWVMNSDGSNPINLTNQTTINPRTFWPDWSPDGTRIVFCRDDDPGCIFVMDADGSNVVYLASGWGTPAWSPGQP